CKSSKKILDQAIKIKENQEKERKAAKKINEELKQFLEAANDAEGKKEYDEALRQYDNVVEKVSTLHRDYQAYLADITTSGQIPDQGVITQARDRLASIVRIKNRLNEIQVKATSDILETRLAALNNITSLCDDLTRLDPQPEPLIKQADSLLEDLAELDEAQAAFNTYLLLLQDDEAAENGINIDTCEKLREYIRKLQAKKIDRLTEAEESSFSKIDDRLQAWMQKLATVPVPENGLSALEQNVLALKTQIDTTATNVDNALEYLEKMSRSLEPISSGVTSLTQQLAVALNQVQDQLRTISNAVTSAKRDVVNGKAQINSIESLLALMQVQISQQLFEIELNSANYASALEHVKQIVDNEELDSSDRVRSARPLLDAIAVKWLNQINTITYHQFRFEPAAVLPFEPAAVPPDEASVEKFRQLVESLNTPNASQSAPDVKMFFSLHTALTQKAYEDRLTRIGQVFDDKAAQEYVPDLYKVYQFFQAQQYQWSDPSLEDMRVYINDLINRGLTWATLEGLKRPEAEDMWRSLVSKAREQHLITQNKKASGAERLAANNILKEYRAIANDIFEKLGKKKRMTPR
ncbi:hypothetical protein HC928_20070, partial [bacterium]|nr:hypothetical protein [bacterium]